MQYRSDRLAHELKNEVSNLIARELRDPRVGFATVTEAKVSPDLSHARIYVSVLGSTEEQRTTLAALNRASGFLRRALGTRLKLRKSPQITFTLDQTIERGARMSQIIAQVAGKDPAAEAPAEDAEPAGKE
jgi:ribosome-binding factor A